MSTLTKNYLRRALKPGTGAFAISSAFIAIGAATAVEAFRLNAEYTTSIQKETELSIGSRHEPRADDPHHALLTPLLLSGVNSSILDSEPEGFATPPEVSWIHNAFQKAVSGLLSGTNAEGLVKSVRSEYKDSRLAFDSEWERRLRFDIELFRSKGTDYFFSREDAECGSATRARAKHFGPLALLRPPNGSEHDVENFHLTVPSLQDLEPSDSRLKYCDRLCRAIRLASVFDNIVSPIVRRQSPLDDGEVAPRVVQAYFISIDNLLAIWRSSADKDPAELYPATRQWSGSNYFQVFLNSDQERYDTPAYIDYSLHGVVRTHARPIEYGGELLGIVCLDVTIPKKAITLPLARSHLLSMRFLRMYQSHTRSLEAWRMARPLSADATGTPQRGGSLRSGWVPVDDETVDRLRRMLFSKAEGELSLDWFRQITKVESEVGPASFFVPLGRSSRHGYYDALWITPKRPGPVAAIGWGLVSLVALCLASFTVAFGLARRIEVAHNMGRIALFQNLQTGIVMVNSDDEIEEANDRAEEILGLELPKRATNTRLTARKQVFMGLIHSDVIPADRYGIPARGTRSYKDVLGDRERGNCSGYYAQILIGPRRGSWIKVMSSPVLECESTSRSSRMASRGGISEPSARVMFGTVEPVSRALALDLEERVRHGGEGAVEERDG